MMSREEIYHLVKQLMYCNAYVKENVAQQNYSINFKADNSPVTSIDMWVHNYLSAYLKSNFNEIPIISEESFKNEEDLPINCWLLDPIDGTKELIHNTGEYCICLALILNHRVVMGFIAIPQSQDVFIGQVLEKKAFKITRNYQERLFVRPADSITCMLKSRFHTKQAETLLYKNMAQHTKLEHHMVGSAIKFCKVAQGQADGFVRLHQTYAWDSAAGVALIIAAGGIAQFIDNNSVVTYNKTQHTSFKLCNTQYLSNLITKSLEL